MREAGIRNAGHGAVEFGWRDPAAARWGHAAPLVADAAVHAGRSPKDKFVVHDATTKLWWDNNNATTAERFEALRQDFLAHAPGKTLFAQDLHLFRRAIPAAASEGLRRLAARIQERHRLDCRRVGSGWPGGKIGLGRRMPIRVTRRVLATALDGPLQKADFRTGRHFGLTAPREVPGVEPRVLAPADLARQGRVCASRRAAGADVPRQFPQVRGAAAEAARPTGPPPRIALA